MTAGIKANVDGSAAIQVGGTDVITLTSGGAATFVTSPTTVQAGTAAAPSITFSGDTNTGIFSPAADTIAFTEGGVESMRIDSAGNVGIGTISPADALTVGTSSVGKNIRINSSSNGNNGLLRMYDLGGTERLQLGVNSTGEAVYYAPTGSVHAWYVNTERMRLDASGNLGVNLTPSAAQGRLQLNGAGQTWFKFYDSTAGFNYGTFYKANGTTGLGYIGAGGGNALSAGTVDDLALRAEGSLLFATGGNTERARIDSSGNFLVGTTSTINNGNTLSKSVSGGNVLVTVNTVSSNPYGVQSRFSAVDPNNTLACYYEAFNAFSNTIRFEVRSNGGIANYSANNVNLSDRREKTNFAPAKNYLDVICAIPVQTFNYIDQNMEDDPGETLGVVAQDVQAVAPEMVMESNWGTEEEPKMRLSIYQTDLQYALMKCIQELKAELDATKAEVAALKGI